MTNKIHITWEQFHNDTKDLCNKIKQAGNFNKIITVSRGGLIPAGIVAYELDIRDTSVVNIRSYNGEDKLEKVEVFGFDGQADENTLVIDDLSDTGRSINILRQLFPKARQVTVYTKTTSTQKPDIYTKEMPNKWIVFPWD